MEKKEFEEKLIKDFPNLYMDMYGDPGKTCMAWGVEIGPGWHDLVYNLSSELDTIIQTFPKDLAKNYRFSQIKEKLGGLRVHMTMTTPEMRALIHNAERDSYHICQRCGKPGKLIKASWLYTSCKEHVKQQEHQNQFEDK